MKGLGDRWSWHSTENSRRGLRGTEDSRGNLEPQAAWWGTNRDVLGGFLGDALEEEGVVGGEGAAGGEAYLLLLVGVAVLLEV